VANGITTVHMSYVREGTGHALIGAREWIPAGHIHDPVTSAVTGLPEGLAFRTKGQLAAGILTEAFVDGVRLDFICGDEVYGACTELREFCEDHDQAYVLRVLQLPADAGRRHYVHLQAGGRPGPRRLRRRRRQHRRRRVLLLKTRLGYPVGPKQNGENRRH
jgi:hypothetical protein